MSDHRSADDECHASVRAIERDGACVLEQKICGKWGRLEGQLTPEVFDQMFGVSARLAIKDGLKAAGFEFRSERMPEITPAMISAGRSAYFGVLESDRSSFPEDYAFQALYWAMEEARHLTAEQQKRYQETGGKAFRTLHR